MKNEIKKVSVKNVPGLNADDEVVIWKLNYGMKSDLQGDSIETSMNELGQNKMTINVAKAKQSWLVYGIYESAVMGIPPLLNPSDPMSEQEKLARSRVIRNLDTDTAEFLYEKITGLNNSELTEKEKEETLKK
jgi:hypothetical protein